MRALALAVLAAVLLAPGAAAHPRAKGYARGFQSKVLSVRPEVAGLAVTVLDGDDRLRVENESGTELVVLGYDGEPYLRIGPNGVFRNQRSPAAYLNRDRFARSAVPWVLIAAVALSGAATVLGLGLLVLRLRRGEGAAAQPG